MATRGSSNGGQMIHLVVKHHDIVEESKTPKDGFEKVQVFNPKTKETTDKYIDRWGSVTGHIDKIEFYDTEEKYATRFTGIRLNIDGEVTLTLPSKSPANDAFSKMAENIDFDSPVTISASKDRKSDRTSFFMSQNGEGIKWKYTKDNPGDCPPWEVDDDGEYDSRKQRAFLKQKVTDIVIPACEESFAKRVGVATNAAAAGAGSDAYGAVDAVDAVDDDDLPF